MSVVGNRLNIKNKHYCKNQGIHLFVPQNKIFAAIGSLKKSSNQEGLKRSLTTTSKITKKM
jgi:hypothetical protein